MFVQTKKKQSQKYEHMKMQILQKEKLEGRVDKYEKAQEDLMNMKYPRASETAKLK